MVKLKNIKTLPSSMKKKITRKRVVKRIKKAFPLATSVLNVNPTGLKNI